MPAQTTTHRRRDALIAAFALLALLVFALLRSSAGTANDGLTIDEPYHYASGVSYARYGDYRLNPEHPPLTKRWVGALAPDSVVMPPLREIREKRDERRFVQTMTYLDNRPEASQSIIRRSMFALNLLLLGAFALVLWRVAGAWWAAGTVAFLAVDPTIGAHLPLLMTDLPVALALGLAAATAAWFADGWRWRGALAFGLAAGLALASKHSALAGLIGIGAALVALAVFARRMPGAPEPARGGRVLRIGAATVLSVVVLWANYGFQYHASPDGSDAFNRPIEAKIDDLASPIHRALLHAADDWRLLPRPYVWGLADTIRAGVEGRGQQLHVLFGKEYKGAPRWFHWPAVIAAKLPIPLMLVALAGLVALLWRAPLSASQKRWLLMIGAMALAFWVALLSSRSTSAGVRHALPLVVAIATLGGALAWRLSLLQKRHAVAFAVAAAPLVVVVGMTAREPNLFGYFNELAGGSKDGWRNFADEGTSMGQEMPAIGRYIRERIPAGTPAYVRTMWFQEWATATRTPFKRMADGIDDSNADGRFEGYFAMDLGVQVPQPDYGWDPKKSLANVTLVERIGTTGIWKGRMHEPMMRASTLYRDVLEHVYESPKPQWDKIAQRCGEILAAMPFHIGCMVERGNALAKLGDVAGARATWAQAAKFAPPDDPTVQQLAALDASIRDDVLPKDARLVRNPWME